MYSKINKYVKNAWFQSIVCSLIASLIFKSVENFFIGIGPHPLIYLTYIILLSIQLYIFLKQESETKIITEHKLYRYSIKYRRLALSGAILISFLFFLSFFKFYQIIYYKATTFATPPDKIGIWVAKYSGGANKHFDQTGLVEKIKFFLNKNQVLRERVEVSELPFEIIGETIKQQEKEAQKYAAKYNASVMVWGVAASEFNSIEELYLYICLAKNIRHVFIPLEHPNISKIEFKSSPEFIKNRTQPLDILSGIKIAKEQTMLGDNTSMTLIPKRIKEPLYIAKFLISLSLTWTDHCDLSKEYINEIINSKQTSMFFNLADLYDMLAQSYLCLFYQTENREHLKSAINIYEKAMGLLNNKKKTFRYSITEYNYGIANIEYAKLGINQKKCFDMGIKKLRSAANFINSENEVHQIYITLAMTYIYGAAFGISPYKNLGKAIECTQKAIETINQVESAHRYKTNFGLKMLLGSLYTSIANYENRESNYKNANKVVNEARSVSKEKKDWNGYVFSLSMHSLFALEQIKFFPNPEIIFNTVEKNLEKIINIVSSYNISKYHSYIAEIFLQLAENGKNKNINLNLAVEIAKSGVKKVNSEKNQNELNDLFFLQAKAYVGLAEIGILNNIENAINLLENLVEKEIVKRKYYKHSDMLNQLGRAYLYSANLLEKKSLMVDRVIRAKKTFESAISVDPKNSQASNNYGISCLVLAELGVDAMVNLSQAIQILEKIIKTRLEEGNLLKHAIAQSDIGACYSQLAANDQNFKVNISRSKKYLQEASFFFLENDQTYLYIMNLIRLGQTHKMSAKYNKNVEDLKLANDYLHQAMIIGSKTKYTLLLRAAIQAAEKVMCLNIELDFQAEQTKKDIENINKNFQAFGFEIKCD